MKVVIAIASYRYPKPQFLAAVTALIAWTAKQRIRYNGEEVQPDLHPLVHTGSSVDLARESLIEGALSLNPDYVLSLDDDMTFPPNSLLRLAGHDLPMVGCNAPRRTADGSIISAASNVVDGRYMPIQAKPEGLEQVDAIGLAVCLIKAPVLKSIPGPRFMGALNEADGKLCDNLLRIGVKPYVDHSLSMEVGHIAETVLTFPR